jgi:hypothetical protein
MIADSNEGIGVNEVSAGVFRISTPPSTCNSFPHSAGHRVVTPY